MSGQVGHGLLVGRASGGSGMISSWWTEAAPWRWTVPRQSAPVSPAADDDHVLARARRSAVRGQRPLAGTRLAGFRYSMAKWMPSQLPTGDGQVAGDRGPAGQHHGVELAQDCRRDHLDVGRALRPGEPARGVSGPVAAGRQRRHRNSMPSATICSRRRSRTAFSILNSGIP